MTIWMVTGLHTDRWLENAMANFERQTFRNKRLILVANGTSLLDNCEPGIVLLRSETGPAHALNRALKFLRENAQPDDLFCKCDADDYYGPWYLHSTLKCNINGADFCGRHSIYLRTQDNKLWFAEGTSSSALFHGPTLVVRVGSALDFPVSDSWGEDQQWVSAMLEAGRTHCSLKPEGFCYQRWMGYQHTWPATDEAIRSAWPVPLTPLGEFNTDIIDGRQSWAT